MTKTGLCIIRSDRYTVTKLSANMYICHSICMCMRACVNVCIAILIICPCLCVYVHMQATYVEDLQAYVYLVYVNTPCVLHKSCLWHFELCTKSRIMNFLIPMSPPIYVYTGHKNHVAIHKYWCTPIVQNMWRYTYIALHQPYTQTIVWCCHGLQYILMKDTATEWYLH